MDKKENLAFEQYLEKVEDPNYQGSDTSWSLPENATPVEKAKYHLCEKMLIYQQNQNCTDKEMADKLKITIGEMRDILYYHIDYFTLERLIMYASYLFFNQEIRIIIEPKKFNKDNFIHAI